MLRSLIALSLAATPLLGSEFSAHHLYAGSGGNDRLVIFDQTGKQVSAIGGASALKDPGAMTFAPDGRLYVVNGQSGFVHALNAKGGIGATLGLTLGISGATALTVTPDGNLLVADENAGTLIEIGMDGTLVGLFGGATIIPDVRDMTFGPDGHLFVASAASSAVLEYDPSGTLLRTIGAGLGLSDPASLAFDARGRLFISSGDADEIVVLDREGALLDRLGAGTALDQPGGLAVLPTGDLVVVSRGSDELLYMSPAGAVLGSGSKNYSSGQDVVVAPRRHKFRTSGTLTTADGTRIKARQNGVISMVSGSLRMMVTLDEIKSDDLLTTFGTRYMVLDGFEAYGAETERKRVYQAAWEPARTPGTGALNLNIVGKVDKNTGGFEVRRGKGRLMRAGPEGVFMGKASARKRLR